jgi:hypothetical protein
MNDETDDRYANARVGDVERRPRMGIREMQIKEKKIDDVTMEEPVGQVAKDTGKQKAKGNISPNVVGAPANEKENDKNKRETGKADEKCVVVLKRSECRAGIGYVHQVEKVFDNDMRIVRRHMAQNKMLGELV